MKILLAIDDSKFSEAAIQQLIAQASPPGTEVRVLHVIEPVPLYPDSQTWGAELAAVQEAQREEGKGLVARAAEKLRRAGFNPTTVVEEGNPKIVILDAAREWRPDLILLGSHGRKGLDRFLMGSVSEAVARHAPCSVEVVRVRTTEKT
jgi:nucleotide-binding universal stress UspA family protein